jgi:hypothetical protein
MKLDEIGDSSYDFPMERDGKFLMGAFTFEGKPYTLQLEDRPLPFPELAYLKTAEVSFFRNDIRGDASFATTGDLDSIPVKVYSVITNRLVDVSANYSAFYFLAERRHSESDTQYTKKQRIYDFMTTQFQRRTGWWYYESSNPFEVLVSRIEVKSDKFRDLRAEAISTLDWSKAPAIK